MSKIEVNTVEPQCGTTLTLGASGDTVTLGSGASQSGFGRTGTVDWQTTPKTGDFTGVNGEGYFINTTSGTITMTLPSASAADIISIQDYNNTFDSNSFTIQAPSGVKINGGTAAGRLVLSTEGQGLTLIYVDATVGWRSIESTTFNTQSQVPSFLTATGGTITTVCTDYKVHTFTGPGTFTVCSVGNPLGSDTVSYMVIAGGGGGSAGAGGAGGYREGRTPQCNTWTASPIACISGCNAGLPVSAQSYPITVGAGAAQKTSGSNSIFSTITSAGGGGNTMSGPGSTAGSSGGSGGGGFQNNCSPAAGGSGNTPPVTPSQGNDGGPASISNNSGGGGGAGGAGAAPPACGTSGNGGAGVTSSINGTPTGRAGGGVGFNGSGTATNGGGIGGGPGGPQPSGGDGSANTGGGGGGGQAFAGGAGGSGIVIIRYKFQ